MSTSKDFAQHVLDLIGDDKHVRVRSMFGEYGLYYDGAMVGFVCDDTVFIKMTERTVAMLEHQAKAGPPYPGAVPAFIIPEEWFDDRDQMHHVLQVCAKDVVDKKKSPIKNIRTMKDLKGK